MLRKIFPFIALCFLLSACTTTSTQPIQSKEEKLGTVYLDAGTDSLMQGKYPDAISSLQRALKYLPESPAVWNNLGLAYAGKGDNAKAKESWLKALAFDPSISDARGNLAALYFVEGNYNLAEKEFKTVLKDDTYPRAAQINYNLALIYLKEHKTLAAEQYLNVAIQSNKSFCPAWEKLGLIQKDRGDTDAAINSLHNSVLGPCFNNPEIHYLIAGLYLRAKDSDKAKAKYLEVIQLFPDSDWAKKAEANLNLMR